MTMARDLIQVVQNRGVTVATITGTPLEALDCFELARLCSLAAQAAEVDPGLPKADREKLSAGYAAQGMATLRKAQAAGYLKDAAVKRLQEDKDFASLRSRQDYRQLLAELEGNQSPGMLREAATPTRLH
jgi:hypothetical protein